MFPKTYLPRSLYPTEYSLRNSAKVLVVGYTHTYVTDRKKIDSSGTIPMPSGCWTKLALEYFKHLRILIRANTSRNFKTILAKREHISKVPIHIIYNILIEFTQQVRTVIGEILKDLFINYIRGSKGTMQYHAIKLV